MKPSGILKWVAHDNHDAGRKEEAQIDKYVGHFCLVEKMNEQTDQDVDTLLAQI